MKARFLLLAVLAISPLWACSNANVGAAPAVNADAGAGGPGAGAPLADPPYGTPYGIGGTFQPAAVPGF